METNVIVELKCNGDRTAIIDVSKNGILISRIFATAGVEYDWDHLGGIRGIVNLQEQNEERLRSHEEWCKINFPGPHKRRDPMTDD